MAHQKIKLLLCFAVVVVPLTAFLSWLRIGSTGAITRTLAASGPDLREIGLATSGFQDVPNRLNYQAVYTNPNAFGSSADGASEVGQIEAVTDLESLPSSSGVGPQSTLSGSEHVPPSAFRSDGFPGAAVGYRFSLFGGTFPGGYIRNNSANPLCMAAPVYLPEGSTVTQFSIYFMDDHPTLDLDNSTSIRLWRKNLASPGNDAQIMAGFASPSTDSTTIFRGFDDTINNAIVNSDYGYYVTFCLYGNTGLQHLIYGFKVDYTQ